MLILLAVNVPLMILFMALWVGIPVWLMLKHPDKGRQITPAPAPAIRHIPQPRALRPGTRHPGYHRVA
jgi:hypothetical protein